MKFVLVCMEKGQGAASAPKKSNSTRLELHSKRHACTGKLLKSSIATHKSIMALIYSLALQTRGLGAGGHCLQALPSLLHHGTKSSRRCGLINPGRLGIDWMLHGIRRPKQSDGRRPMRTNPNEFRGSLRGPDGHCMGCMSCHGESRWSRFPLHQSQLPAKRHMQSPTAPATGQLPHRGVGRRGQGRSRRERESMASPTGNCYLHRGDRCPGLADPDLRPC